MVRAAFVLLAFTAALSACSMTYPVYAKFEDGSAEFVGTATSSLAGSDFVMTSGTGVQCTGTYDAEMVMSGFEGAAHQGNVRCTDGGAGFWAVSGTTRGGQEIGNIDGRPFKIFYGDMARVSIY